MAWSEKIYPSFRLDSERERALLRRVLALGQIHEYLGLDSCPRQKRWIELRLLYHRLTLLMEHYQTIPEGPERAALRPVVAEAMLHLADCRSQMSDRRTADTVDGGDIRALLGVSFLPPL